MRGTSLNVSGVIANLSSNSSASKGKPTKNVEKVRIQDARKENQINQNEMELGFVLSNCYLNNHNVQRMFKTFLKIIQQMSLITMM